MPSAQSACISAKRYLFKLWLTPFTKMKAQLFVTISLILVLLSLVSGYETYSISDSELTSGYTQVLKSGDTFAFSLEGKEYKIMASSVLRTSAQMSVPPLNHIQFLNLNEENKFELTGDNNYDISLKLTDTNWTDLPGGTGSVDFNGTFTIKKISEEVPEGTELPASCFKYYDCPNGIKVQYCEYSGSGCGCKSNPSSLCPVSSGDGNDAGGPGSSNETNAIPPNRGNGSDGFGQAPVCERYYNCSDGKQVQYCFIHKMYNENGELVGAGCGCKTPESLCSSGEGNDTGGPGEPTIIPSASGNGSDGKGPGSNETPISCNGCILGDKCVPFGYRQEGKYCTINSEFISQLSADASCENSFECSSNLCIDNQCVSSGLWQKIIRWFKGIFG